MSLLRARLAILGLFLIHGLVVATWASRLPVIQSRLGISAGQLGVLLLASAIGAILAMPVTGKLMAQLGSKRVVIVSSFAFCLVLPGLALAPNSLWMAVALFLYGFTAGVMDVSMNAQAVFLEKQYQKSIMIAFHAFFSIGGLLGSVLGSFSAAQRIAPSQHFIGAAIAYAVVVAVASCFLIADRPAGESKKGPLFATFSWPLFGLCMIGFCCFLSEGAIIDWSGIYLYRVLHSGESMAALGFAFFSIAMTFGRLVGDALADRFGAALLVLLGCLFAGGGMTFVLLSPSVLFALAGFTLVGIGFSVIVPLVFSASGRIGGNSYANLTTITLFSYCAFLLGPPLIGLLADLLGLRLALALIVVLTLVGALFSKVAFPPVSQESQSFGELAEERTALCAPPSSEV